MLPEISIIMPSFNVVRYIEECLESVIHQTFTDIEIINVDAGSTDGTLEILKKYARKDSRIKLLHSEKKSYGHQVNVGVDLAKGKYIGIVDTDDKIFSNMYEILYKEMEEDVDYVKGTAEIFFSLPNEEIYSFPVTKPFRTKEYEEGIKIVPSKSPALLTTDNFLWYGLYKADFLKQIKLHETPGAAFQDMGALFQTQIKAKKAVYIDKVVYYYRQDNVNSSIYNPKGFGFVANEYEYAEQFLLGLSSEWHTSFYRKLFHHFMDRMYAMAASGDFWEDTLSDMQRISKKLEWANDTDLLTKKDLPAEQWKDLQLLWKNPRLLYDKYNNLVIEGKKALERVIRHLKDNQGIIFGSGKRGEFLHAQMLYRGYKNIIAYCDNNIETQGKEKYGTEIFSPEEVIKRFSGVKYIIASKDYAEEMKNQLLCLGIRERDIWIYSYGVDIRLFGVRLD